MHTLIASAVDHRPTSSPPPVDDLLRVYLGQSSAARAPDVDRDDSAGDGWDLWDRLGDFA
jgi:hypothetical protein